MPTLREWVIEIAVILVVGVVLAALGPFGSFAMGSFGARLAYWLPAALIGYAIFRPITLATLIFARRLELPMIASAPAGALIAAIPGTVAIAYLGGYRGPPRFDQLFGLYINVALVGMVIMTIFILNANRAAVTSGPQMLPAAAPPAPVAVTSVRFLERLPGAWGDRLVALEMEDHYVRAHGPDASALILLRMSDAEAELAGFDGLRVHRSWWVARSAVKGVVRDGRSYRLRLSNGIEAPVARDRVAVLKDARWIS